MARPKRVFTEREIKLIEYYALNGGKNNTIAMALGMPVNTLTNRFMGLLKRNRAKRKLKLAHCQTKQSQHNSQMAIFLGKNELNQTDKQVIETKQTPLEQTNAQRKATEAAAREYKLSLVRPSA